MSYFFPDAYRHLTPPEYIPEDRHEASGFNWRKKVFSLGVLAGTRLLMRLPYKGEVPYLDLGLRPLGLTWKQITGERLQLGDYVLNLLKQMEEEAPFHLGRMFGAPERLSHFILGKRAKLDIPFEVLQRHHRYYETLIPGFRTAEYQSLRLQGGRLYGITRTGDLKELLAYARLRLVNWIPPVESAAHHTYSSQLSRSYQEILARSRGVTYSPLVPSDDPFPFLVTGSTRSELFPWRTYLRDIQSLAETWNRRFFKLLDNPLETFSEIGLFSSDIPGIKQAGAILQRYGLTNRFGLGGYYHGSIPRQWLRWLFPGRNIMGGFRPGALLTFVGLPFAYRAADQFFRDHQVFQDTILEHGLSGAAATVWQRLMLARAKVGEFTGLSQFARWQEELAPGSTDIGALMSLSMAGGVAGGLYGFFKTRLVRGRTVEETWRNIREARHVFTGPLRRIFSHPYTYTGKLIRSGLAAGALLGAPFLPGAVARFLGGLKSPEELTRIYSGQEEVPVYKGRFWEFGSSFFGGTKVDYYRPHWTVMAKSDYLNRGLFRGDEHWLFKAAKRTPILTDIVDPYYFERLHYYDRPYPMTGPSMPGLAVIGPIYAATIGKLFKPTKLMHLEEWRLPHGYVYQKEEHPSVLELGGLPPAAPEDPYGRDNILTEVLERWTEAIGLPGWLLRTSMQIRDWHGGTMSIASAERMTSEERQYWDLSFGGLMGVTEWYRRINVRMPSAIRQLQYNPLSNRMPSWLPGEDYFIDFRSGDPYTKIPQGEARLPGPGYAALHPELEGIDPEDYPFLHRLKILANVAPYASETQEHLQHASLLNRLGAFTPQEWEQIKTIRQQLRMVKKRKFFTKYREDEEFDSYGLLGWLGRYWQTLSHQTEQQAVWETLLPFRPLAKFIHSRDPLEDYELSVIHGADQGFWHRYWSHFIRPTLTRIRRRIDSDYIPKHTALVSTIDEYFDKLRYLKARLHTRRALEAGDMEAAKAWLMEAHTTRTGITVRDIGFNFAQVMSALPRRERDYFPEFSKEEDPERQQRILEMVPADVGRIYRLIWDKQLLSRVNRAAAEGQIDLQQQRVQDLLEAVRFDLRTGGRASKELLERYQEEQPDLPIEDWLRGQEVLEFFQQQPLPPPESVVWDPRVDLEDVKLKVIKYMAADIHDYDLWEARERTLPRKPYLENVVPELLAERDPAAIRRQLEEICNGFDLEAEISVQPVWGKGAASIEIAHDQRLQLQSRLEQLDHGRNRPVRRSQIPQRRRRRRPQERV